MVLSIDSSLLLSYYGSRTAGSGGTALTSSLTRKTVPTAPWLKPSTEKQTAAAASAAVKAALAGHKFFNDNATQLDVRGASADYRKLFSLYQGLSTLADIVTESQKKGLTSIDKQRLRETFAKGMEELGGYVTDARFEKLRMALGEVGLSAKSTAPVGSTKQEYVTKPIYSGASTDAVPQFAGNVRFTINVTRSGTVHAVNIDLAGMGTQTRSLANVVTYINGKLEAEGVDTRIQTQRTAGAERTTTVNGKTVSLGFGPDQFALKVVPKGETVTFAATATAGAVYMAQAVGDPNPDGKLETNDGVVNQQLLKFQTDAVAVDAPIQGQNDANWVDGRTFARTLGPEIKTVRTTKVGSDGSVYMLADVTGKTGGQEIAGSQDVALIKYDPAGNVVFTRTLGASDSASGLGLAISADGDIAIAGSVSGGLNGATEGALNSTGAYEGQTDSFVTVFNSDGEEQWTQRRGARQGDEASQLTFGADGTVYIAGRAQSTMPGATAVGGWDNYIEGFAPPDATGKVATVFTQQFGTAGADRPAGMVLDGTNLVTASVEDGRAVLRRFDISSGAPVLSSTRDLGDLQGGDIAGLALDGGQIVIAGSTRNGALAAGTPTAAGAYKGGLDAFAARISADLSAGGEAIAYYGGAGDDKATALSVAGGKVWIAGSVGTDLQGGLAPVGKKDGFLANLNLSTGDADWSRRFTGKDGYAAPSSIAVDPTGSSALDRLGLPQGTIDLSDSSELTAASSLRAGEEFTIRVGTGHSSTVTIEDGETLDTLAQKIRRATGFQSKVSIGTVDGVRKLTIEPENKRQVIEIGAGREGKNALDLLGIPEGVIRTTVVIDGKTKPADGKGQIYGLGLSRELNLDDATQISHAAAEIAQAIVVVRQAYRDLADAAHPKTPAQLAAAKGKSGKVPTYLTNQIANYQAALDRLQGG